MATALQANIVEQYRAGDEAAFEALYRRWRGSVFSAVWRTLPAYLRGNASSPELVEDLTQETWLRVVQYIGRFDGRRASFGSWVYKVAMNATRDWLRGQHNTKRNIKTTESLDAMLADDEDNCEGNLNAAVARAFGRSTDSPLALAMATEAQRRIAAAIARLDKKDRWILARRLYAGETLKEIAESQSEPISTVKTRFQVAFTRLVSLARNSSRRIPPGRIAPQRRVKRSFTVSEIARVTFVVPVRRREPLRGSRRVRLPRTA